MKCLLKRKNGMLDEAREKKKLLHDAYCSANSSSFLHSV